MSKVDVRVVTRGKNKFAVLVNYIQWGPEYTSEVTAKAEAQKLIDKKIY